jgi:hypothetical protein
VLDTFLTQPFLNSKCLTFLVLEGGLPGMEGERTTYRVAQTYSLETGVVYWPRGGSGGPQVSVSLRANSQLANWDPMTSSKFASMALESGAAGEDIDIAGRVIHPEIAAVTVSPQGFVFCWDSNRGLAVSDVGRLANVHEPLTRRWDGWSRYSFDENRVVSGPGDGKIPPDRAWVGNGRAPYPIDLEQIHVKTLAHCGIMTASPIEEAGNDIFGNYTPEAAVFIKRQFGVEINDIDWQAANQARLINEKFSHAALFDLHSARAALRLAIAHDKAKQTTPTLTPPAAPSRDLIGRALAQQPTTRPSH